MMLVKIDQLQRLKAFQISFLNLARLELMDLSKRSILSFSTRFTIV